MSFEAHYEREDSAGWLITSWGDANTLLGYQRANGPSYSIFTLKNGSYVQCAGGKKSLVVEVRIVDTDGCFHHYRFGKGEQTGIQEDIACHCGDITVDSSQRLTMRDARLIIKHFVETHGTLLSSYHASDITHTFE